MAEARIWTVYFTFLRKNNFGDIVKSDRKQTIWTDNAKDAIARALVIFNEEEPTATNVRGRAE